MSISILRCELSECGKSFVRATTGSSAKYCSKKCRSRAYYLSHSTHEPRQPRDLVHQREYQRDYRRQVRASGKLRDYEREYNRRPEVQERQRLRASAEYRPHPRVRRTKAVLPDVTAPYRGHPWLEMAHKAVTADLSPFGGEFTERRWDEMGEALLAVLEGRDAHAAVVAYRKSEYVPRYLTQHIADWQGSDDEQNRRFEAVMPKSPSAEDEAVAREAVVLRKHRYRRGTNKSLMGSGKRQRPSQRRMNNDAGWRKHELRNEKPRS